MSVFKCKMCGGDLEITEGMTVAECQYCGTKQTLPKLDDEKRANLYDRANHFRRNNEFDKASNIYEQILNEDNTDAEAYWSLVLCRYGIEYVEDPATRKRVPTVNRAQFTSIFDDEDYKSALQYADGYQKEIYEAEANAINEIQKGILAISQKEEPFDVFICYKETDNNGHRTPDSVLANDLYHQLTQEGFKVFFSRITLEDKLGTAYEPYIFAALNSAKVMVVLGTKPEYFNAVWVKNEWSRYLALVKQSGGKKILIPAYKDMDPYGLPEEFSHLQAQDMSKLGFMQDLIRGIKKIVSADAPIQNDKDTVATGGGSNIATLLKRAFMFLEDGSWQDADEYCEKVLDIDPENVEAYLGKLMADMHAKNREALADCVNSYSDNSNYKKILRFGDENLKNSLQEYIKNIETRNKNIVIEEVYSKACKIMELAVTSKEDEQIANYEIAIKLFESVSAWKDSVEKISECKVKIEEIKAKKKADMMAFESRLKAAKQKEKKQRKLAVKIAIIAISVLCAAVILLSVLVTVIIPNNKYNSAVKLIDSGKYVDAYETLVDINGYKDSAEKANSIYDKYKSEKFKNLKAGDYVYFGKYEQDNDTSNGKEYIKWSVLEVKDGKALVISEYALDGKQYNAESTAVTWETCTLREWLNNDFINTAFSDNEKSDITAVNVPADKNPKYNTEVGNSTQDKVFLLSIDEADKYFTSDEALRCEATYYAEAQGVYKSSDKYCFWWLRTPGFLEEYAAGVSRNNEISDTGRSVNNESCAVRPAMWLDLSEQ